MIKENKIIYAVLMMGSVAFVLFPMLASGTEYILPKMKAEWSNTLVHTAPSPYFPGPNFRGRFGNSTTLTLKLTGLPSHTSFRIEFDLYIINSWDGNWVGSVLGPDYWRLIIDDTQVLNTTFCNGAGNNRQAYPGDYPASNPSRTGAVQNNVLDFPSELPNVGNYGDAIYSLDYTVDHSDRQIIVSFISEGLQQMLDESWGIDKVVVTTYSNGTPQLVYSNDFDTTYSGIVAATHTHSEFSDDDGYSLIGTLLSWIDDKLNGELGVCNISAHAKIETTTGEMPWGEAAFALTGNVRPIRGEEWGDEVDTNDNGFVDTQTGHASVFNIDDSSNNPIYVENYSDGSGTVSAQAYSTLLDNAAGRGALVWANHPCHHFYSWSPRFSEVYQDVDANQDGDYYDAGDWLKGIEGRMIGTEVWTEDWGAVLVNNQGAVDWWQEMLSLGKRKVVGIAASDYHINLRSILTPCSRVYAPTNSAEDVAAAIRAGRVVMAESVNSAYAILEADADGDGNFETFIGDTIHLYSSGDINFRVKCFGCKKTYRMRIYTDAATYKEVDCEQGTPWVHTFSKSFSSYEKNFVRIEIRKGQSMITMTNPIYINIDLIDRKKTDRETGPVGRIGLTPKKTPKISFGWTSKNGKIILKAFP